jgi:RNA polymerase sigma-70 factor (ECF subfamily)
MEDKTHVSEIVFRFLLKRSKSPEVAKEVLQNTWVAVLKSYKIFSHKSSYFTWLCKIALNKLSDYYRDQVRNDSRILIPTIKKLNQLIDPKISIEEKLVLDDLKFQVNKCLDLLPAKYRQLLHLRYYEHLTTREISLKLRVPVRSLEGKLYRAKRMFAQIYAKV